ncbi:hypothetical protein [Streptomyces tsukubensis]|uniref:hypothetical protein n=1 Tax=Streptomyces tsukubensis TaxID=83656 RepID=UPI00344EA100
MKPSTLVVPGPGRAEETFPDRSELLSGNGDTSRTGLRRRRLADEDGEWPDLVLVPRAMTPALQALGELE